LSEGFRRRWGKGKKMRQAFSIPDLDAGLPHIASSFFRTLRDEHLCMSVQILAIKFAG
jgi:hypothetical protein